MRPGVDAAAAEVDVGGWGAAVGAGAIASSVDRGAIASAWASYRAAMPRGCRCCCCSGGTCRCIGGCSAAIPGEGV